jgi:hypothetical protein
VTIAAILALFAAASFPRRLMIGVLILLAMLFLLAALPVVVLVLAACVLVELLFWGRVRA